MSILPASLVAFLSYYYLLLSTPTPRLGILISVGSSPRLSQLYNAWNWLLRVVFRRGNELQRALRQPVSQPRTARRIAISESAEGEELVHDEADDDSVRLLARSRDDASSKSSVTPPTSKEEAVACWRIDYAISHSRELQDHRRTLAAAALSDDALVDLGNEICILKYPQAPATARTLLQNRLKRLNDMHVGARALVDRSETQYNRNDKKHEAMLRELWRLLKPDKELEAISTKQWQDLGFQGKDPATDWRATGLLGLDALLHFARSYKTDGQASRIVIEAVEGGAGWYPFAIVSITLTDFLISLLRLSSLSYVLLASPAGAEQTFFTLHSLLVLHFHGHWLRLQTSEDPKELSRPRPTVMDFERVFARWRREVGRWVERGRVMGWVDSRGLVEVEWPESLGEEESVDAEEPQHVHHYFTASGRFPS